MADEHDLYHVLGVPKDASQSEIKKAYCRLALKLHPDKNGGDAAATEKFQKLQKVYDILSDPERRKAYDEHGTTDEDALSGSDLSDLQEYFRLIFRKVTDDDISDFEAKYRGSDEEKRDLLAYYEQFRGDMDSVYSHLMCSIERTDDHRFATWIDEAVEAGAAQKFAAYDKWAKAVRKRKPHPDPLGSARVQGAAGGHNALVAAIRGNQEKRLDSLLESLAAKYGPGPGKGKKRKGEAARGEEEGEEEEEEERPAKGKKKASGASEGKARGNMEDGKAKKKKH